MNVLALLEQFAPTVLNYALDETKRKEAESEVGKALAILSGLLPESTGLGKAVRAAQLELSRLEGAVGDTTPTP